MKPIKKQFLMWPAVPAVLAITWTVSVAGAANPPSAKDAKDTKPVINQSIFVLPTGPAEGRDPFFPDSNRPYEAAMAKSHVKDEVSLLEFKGFSGTPDARLAIINNHTFAAGDEEYVLTDQGRVQVRCLEVKSNSVIVEVSGQRHELSFTKSK